MCGRYLFSQTLDQESLDFLETLEVSEKQSLSLQDVYPSQKTLVLKDPTHYQVMRWGYQKWDSKQVIINARTESVQDSPFFKEDLKLRRCIIKASGFYEWDHDKQKHLIQPKEDEAFYMAGLYTDEKEPRFAILTQASSDEFSQLHHRIPLMIPKKYLQEYFDQGDQHLKDFTNLKQAPLIIENQSILNRLF